MGIFLGHLPIELTINPDRSQITIIPRYFPYDDDFFRKIYYSADQLYLCLEVEDTRHKYVRHRSSSKNHIRKKLHTKFWSITNWTINSSFLGDSFIYEYKYINTYISRIKKSPGFEFKIRATYRYDRTIYTGNGHKIVYNKARTHVYSNELILTK